MQIVAHMLQFEMCREDIPGHIMGITGGETDAVQSFDIVDLVKKLPKGG